MIDKKELQLYAEEQGLRVDIVEKDYILGWLLASIYQHKNLKDQWIFKGGTCLKKCYFKDYRFSEDLDFTLRTFDHINQAFLQDTFKDITDSLSRSTSIEFPIVEFEVFDNPRGKIAAQGKIGYKGPNARRSSIPKIKIDLSADETIVLSSNKKVIYHPYSDIDEQIFYAQTYQYPEVFAEKLRALIERTRPRDLYDVVHIYHKQDIRPNSKETLELLEKKCDFKGIKIPTLNELMDSKNILDLKDSWHFMLEAQMKAIPSADEYLDQLDEIFAWLHRN